MTYLEASFAIQEITLTAPKMGSEFQILKTKKKSSFMKIFEKITKKNVLPRKLQGLESSHLEARFAILESTLTATNYRFENF